MRIKITLVKQALSSLHKEFPYEEIQQFPEEERIRFDNLSVESRMDISLITVIY